MLVWTARHLGIKLVLRYLMLQRVADGCWLIRGARTRNGFYSFGMINTNTRIGADDIGPYLPEVSIRPEQLVAFRTVEISVAVRSPVVAVFL
jgi:hypothetical protein